MDDLSPKVAESPADQRPVQHLVLVEQVRLLYAGLPLSQTVALVNGVVLAAVQAIVIEAAIVIFWLASLALVTLGRFAVGALFKRASASAGETARWLARFRGGVIAAGIVVADPNKVVGGTDLDAPATAIAVAPQRTAHTRPNSIVFTSSGGAEITAREVLTGEEVAALTDPFFQLATPPGAHEQYALRVAAAGKPCYVEKPMARSYVECARMIEAMRGGPKSWKSMKFGPLSPLVPAGTKSPMRAPVTPLKRTMRWLLKLAT